MRAGYLRRLKRWAFAELACIEQLPLFERQIVAPIMLAILSSWDEDIASGLADLAYDTYWALRGDMLVCEGGLAI